MMMMNLLAKHQHVSFNCIGTIEPHTLNTSYNEIIYNFWFWLTPPVLHNLRFKLTHEYINIM